MGLVPNQSYGRGKLPPTRGTFIPHLKRANYTSWRDKPYRVPNPDLPPIDGNGWTVSNNIYVPQRCILPAAPAGVLELVKCSCKGSCDPEKTICSCVRNKLSCTALCKCFDCHNTTDYKKLYIDDDEEEWT